MTKMTKILKENATYAKMRFNQTKIVDSVFEATLNQSAQRDAELSARGTTALQIKPSRKLR